MFSGAVKLLDLNDFIAPSQDCVIIKPDSKTSSNALNIKQINSKSDINNATEGLKGKESSKDDASKPIKVSLHDCLACSGCVTSAETVLLHQQSEDEFLAKLKQKEFLVAITISPQSRAALAEYYGLSPAHLAARLNRALRRLGVWRVYDLATARDLALLETANDFVQRLRLSRQMLGSNETGIHNSNNSSNLNNGVNYSNKGHPNPPTSPSNSSSTLPDPPHPSLSDDSTATSQAGSEMAYFDVGGKGGGGAAKRVAPRVFGRGRAKTFRSLGGTAAHADAVQISNVDPSLREEKRGGDEGNRVEGGEAKKGEGREQRKPEKHDVAETLSYSSPISSSNNNSIDTKSVANPPSLPVLSSSCPGWVIYAEKSQNSSSLLPHLCSSRSPQAIQGALIKQLLSPKLKIGSGSGSQRRSIFHVSVMPCYDKKLEAARDDLTSSEGESPFFGISNTSSAISHEIHGSDQIRTPDTDCCLTTSELLNILDRSSLDLGSQDLKAKESGSTISAEPEAEEKGKGDGEREEGEKKEGHFIVEKGVFDSIVEDITSLDVEGDKCEKGEKRGGGREGTNGHHMARTRQENENSRNNNDNSKKNDNDNDNDHDKDNSNNSDISTPSLYGMGGGSGGYASYVFRLAAQRVFGQTVLDPVEFKSLRNSDFQEAVLYGNTVAHHEARTNAPFTDASSSPLPYQSATSGSPSPVPLMKVARVYGFRNIQTLLRQIRSKRCPYDFVEVMACPGGGCLNGGGQPKPQDYARASVPESASRSREEVVGGTSDSTLTSGPPVPLVAPPHPLASKKPAVLTPQEVLEKLEAKYHHDDVAFRLPESNPEVVQLLSFMDNSGQGDEWRKGAGEEVESRHDGDLDNNALELNKTDEYEDGSCKELLQLEALKKMTTAKYVVRERTNVTSATSLANMW